jgi:endonuclease-3
MDKNTYANLIYERLDTLLPKDIQFLDQRDPFRFLISVILSAQTTDRTVNAVVRTLFDVYPDAPSLAKAKREEVEEIIFPTGFYRNKAKNIIACAQGFLIPWRSWSNYLEWGERLPAVCWVTSMGSRRSSLIRISAGS